MKTLLIIERDPELVDIYRSKFGAKKDLNIEVLLSRYGESEETIRAIEKIKPDLLLMYIRPDDDGITILEELFQKRRMPPTIVLTYDRRRDTREKCLRLGVKEYRFKTHLSLRVLWWLIAEHLGFSPEFPWKSERQKITEDKVREAAKALEHLNPDAKDILWAMGIGRPTKAQIALVEVLIKRNSLNP